MSTSGLLGRYVMDVCSGDAETSPILWSTADANTVCIYSVEIVGERGMTEVKGTG